MTRRASSFRAVGIDPPYAAVGPSARVEFTVALVLHRRAVTLHAAIDRGRSAFDHFTEDVVERADKAGGLRVMRGFKLGDFFLVAPVAVVRRYNNCDLLAVVIERRRIAFVGLVAGVAIDTVSIMRAVFPLFDDARRGVLVALQTLLSFRRNRGRLPPYGRAKVH